MNSPQDIKVLIVDDDFLVSEMTHGLVDEIGYTVIGKAIDGYEAIEMTQELQPDVILMDVEMPIMDGIESARIIHEKHPTPIVILTAYDNQHLVQKASNVGVGAYLVKPPDAMELERAITIARARFTDMVALKQMNDELASRNEELQALNEQLNERNQELDAFARTVAHDLKSPLHLIIGFSEYLLGGSDIDEPTRQALQSIFNTGQKMDRITEELLLLAGVHKTKVVIEPLDMTKIVNETLQRLVHIINESQGEVNTPDTWPTALGYAPWVEEIWANYISNGFKYGGTPPRLQLGATVEGDVVHFWVQDNGPGISEIDQAKLFTDFTRLDHKRVDGHGLGLSIVSRIVEKLNGSASVESVLGQGSCFRFTLPLDQP